MEVTRTAINGNHLQCGKYEFEPVKELSYLGSQMNQTKFHWLWNTSKNYQRKPMLLSCGALMKSRALNRSSKLKIYKTLIRPAVTYGCEAWTLTSWNEQQLRIFERKILRKLFGLVQDEKGIWRIRKNHELKELKLSKIYKKQKNGLARTLDADGWRENV